jgi:hypothetical protein
MALIPLSYYRDNSRFPTPPSTKISIDTFPNDLIQSNRGYYTELTFMKYTNGGLTGGFQLQGIGGRGKPMTASGGVKLPLPKKINDNQTLSWTEISSLETAVGLAQKVAGAVGGLAGFAAGRNNPLSGVVGAYGASSVVATAASAAASPAVGAITGYAINPFQFMTFKQPNYKEFSFTWSFAPNNPQESRTLQKIITQFKQRSLPTNQGLYLEYPDILSIRMFPEDGLGMRFKNCAIISVQVDYTGAGAPSFFRDTQAPTVVNLSLMLKEIQLWDQADYGLQY